MGKKAFMKNNDSVNQEFENHLILRASIIGSGISFVGALSNWLLGLSDTLTWATFFGFFGYLLLYFLVRWGLQRGRLFIWTTVFTILYLNILWFLNNRGEGPILYLLMVCYLFVPLWPGKINFKVIALAALLNLVVLFFLDLHLPENTGLYPSRFSKLLDNYLVAFFSIFLLLVIVSILKKYYKRELEHAQESDKLKAAFLANLSHEIRTPLNAIIGFSSFITSNPNSPENAEFIEMVEKSGDQLCKLVDQLITIAKIESECIELKPEACNLEELFAELFNEYSQMAREKNLAFDYKLVGTKTIYTDVNLLKAVLDELLSNAFKFSERGKIRFSAVNKSEKCIFVVKDSGIGIRKENLQKIFGRFIKIDEYTSNLVRGTGIGLTLAQSIVQKLGGNITVKSTFKKGTIFFFSLPVLQLDLKSDRKKLSAKKNGGISLFSRFSFKKDPCKKEKKQGFKKQSKVKNFTSVNFL